MPRSFLPLGDTALLNWAQNFVKVLQAGTAGQYGLSTAQIATVAGLTGAYQAALDVATHSNTRTRPAVAAKDKAKSDLAADIRVCVGLVQKTPGISDSQRRELKITVAKKRAPVPAPVARPMTEIVGVVGHGVSMNVYDSTSATKRGKPLNCVGAKVYTFVGTAYPSDPGLWDYQGDFTKTKVDLTFGDDVDGGAQVFVCAAWYTRTAVGPVSMPVSTFLQGGSVQATAAKPNTPSVKIAA